MTPKGDNQWQVLTLATILIDEGAVSALQEDPDQLLSKRRRLLSRAVICNDSPNSLENVIVVGNDERFPCKIFEKKL